MPATTQPLSLPTLEELSKPIAAYPRVSRVGDRSGESYISPDIQIEAMRRWAEDRGVEIVVFPAEENVSGGTMDRPIFNEVMRGIRDGEFGGLLVWKLDRFARDLEGGLRTMRELVEHRAVFASATEPTYDFTTADGKMLLSQQLLMSEYFKNRATEGWRISLTYAVGRGVHIAPGDRFGYAKNGAKVLVPDAAAPFVRGAFEMRAGGATFEEIARSLNAEAPPRPDARPWVGQQVDRMVRSRVYLGEARWGDQVNPDAHEAIVSPELWEAAQRRVPRRSKRYKGEDVALLNGLVRCAACRFGMSRARNRSGGYDRKYMRCKATRASGKCPHPASVRADGDDGLEALIEDLVCRELDRRAGRFAEVADSDALAEANTALHAAREDLAAMQSDTTARRRLGSRWLEFAVPYVAAVEQAEARVRELERQHGADAREGLTVDAYRSLPRPDRADVLADMIDVVFVRSVGGPRGPHAVSLDGRRVRVLWRGQGPTDLPASNKVGELKPWPWPDDE